MLYNADFAQCFAHTMEQLESFSIPSPCIGVCQANSKGYCKGCLRSRKERLYWLKLTGTQKQNVLRLCRLRKHKLLQLAVKQQAVSIELPEQMDFDFF